jgi:hypothetical protein
VKLNQFIPEELEEAANMDGIFSLLAAMNATAGIITNGKKYRLIFWREEHE